MLVVNILPFATQSLPFINCAPYIGWNIDVHTFYVFFTSLQTSHAVTKGLVLLSVRLNCLFLYVHLAVPNLHMHVAYRPLSKLRILHYGSRDKMSPLAKYLAHCVQYG